MIYQVSHINTENQQNCDDNRTAKETGGSSGTEVTFLPKEPFKFRRLCEMLIWEAFPSASLAVVFRQEN